MYGRRDHAEREPPPAQECRLGSQQTLECRCHPKKMWFPAPALCTWMLPSVPDLLFDLFAHGQDVRRTRALV